MSTEHYIAHMSEIDLERRSRWQGEAPSEPGDARHPHATGDPTTLPQAASTTGVAPAEEQAEFELEFEDDYDFRGRFWRKG
jgi:hypothetical protein